MKRFLTLLLFLLPLLASGQGSVLPSGVSGRSYRLLGTYGFSGIKLPVVPDTGSASTSTKLGSAGTLIYDSVNKIMYVHNGSGWTMVGTGTGPGSAGYGLELNSGTYSVDTGSDEKNPATQGYVERAIINAMPAFAGLCNTVGADTVAIAALGSGGSDSGKILGFNGDNWVPVTAAPPPNNDSLEDVIARGNYVFRSSIFRYINDTSTKAIDFTNSFDFGHLFVTMENFFPELHITSGGSYLNGDTKLSAGNVYTKFLRLAAMGGAAGGGTLKCPNTISELIWNLPQYTGNLTVAEDVGIKIPATLSGDGSTTTFTISHTDYSVYGYTTTYTVVIVPKSAEATKDAYISNVTATSFDVNFITAPASGTNNVVFDYILRK